MWVNSLKSLDPYKAVGESKRCPYCEAENNNFIQANQSIEYSGIDLKDRRERKVFFSIIQRIDI